MIALVVLFGGDGRAAFFASSRALVLPLVRLNGTDVAAGVTGGITAVVVGVICGGRYHVLVAIFAGSIAGVVALVVLHGCDGRAAFCASSGALVLPLVRLNGTDVAAGVTGGIAIVVVSMACGGGYHIRAAILTGGIASVIALVVLFGGDGGAAFFASSGALVLPLVRLNGTDVAAGVTGGIAIVVVSMACGGGYHIRAAILTGRVTGVVAFVILRRRDGRTADCTSSRALKLPCVRCCCEDVAALVTSVITVRIGTKLRHRQITDRDRLTGQEYRDVVHTEIEFGNCLRARFHKDVFAAREHVQAHRIVYAIQDHLEILFAVDHIALGRFNHYSCGTVRVPFHFRQIAGCGHPAPTVTAVIADCKCNATVLGIGNPIGDLVHAVGIQRGNIRGF